MQRIWSPTYYWIYHQLSYYRPHASPFQVSLPTWLFFQDILMRIHFFNVKDQLLAKTRALETLLTPYSYLQLYVDLFQHMLQLQCQLNTITKALHIYKSLYKGGCCAKLLITRNCTSHSINAVDDDLKLLHSWGKIPFSPNAANSQQDPVKIILLWYQASKKTKTKLQWLSVTGSHSHY